MTSEDSGWYRSLTIAERVALGALPQIVTPEGEKSAAWRLSKWRGQSPFNSPEWLSRRLESEGLSESGFLALLGELPSALQERCASLGWPSRLAVSLSLTEPDGQPPRADALTAISQLVAPLLDEACRRLHRRAEDAARLCPQPPFDPSSVVSLFQAELPAQIWRILGRSVILEMHASQSQLSGGSPSERFQGFFAQMREQGRCLAFFAEFPVLARTLLEWLDLWVDSAGEFLERLSADWSDLVAAFAGKAEPGMLQGIQGGMGDRHRGGRTVMIARFSSGFHIVYKPKSLAVDRHFAECCPG